MLKLNLEGIKDNNAWRNAGITLPAYYCRQVVEYSKNNPIWIHFGAGNIFRGFIAGLQQKLLNDGLEKSGIIAVDTFDYDIIDKIYKPYDNLSLSVGLRADGNTDIEIIGSITEALHGNSADTEQMQRLKEVFTNRGLQMVSFTITEKGYSLSDMKGELLPVVTEDMKAGPLIPRHTMSFITALVYDRFLAGGYPLALVSMDNCSHNGEKLKSSVMAVAEAWYKNGFVSREFLNYLEDESKISFPWSMIDKITPRPAKVVEEILAKKGIMNMKPVITNKNTYIAPFVNAEIPQYLVVEDRFPNGRPALEKAGVYMTDRDTVNKTEKMKVTTCLNPLHTALAVYGCLLGYTSIADEMKDTELRKLVENIGYKEGIPVVTDPGIINPMDFIKEVIEQRLPNPFIPDTPQRIATDTSMKVPIRYGETIKSYINTPGMDVMDLTYIPLAIAGWFRYLLAIDDEGEKMDISSDPMLEQLKEHMKGIEYGNPASYSGQLRPVLANEKIFAVDLCQIGLAEKIEGMFCSMLEGNGAVRAVLREYLK